MTTAPRAKTCPACNGVSGHEHTMTESHTMGGAWGEAAESGDSGQAVKPIVRSLVRCLDCGAKFTHAALARKGYLRDTL